MKKNDLIKRDNQILRILHVRSEKVLVIDCIKQTMPIWIPISECADYVHCEEEFFYEMMDFSISDEKHITQKDKEVVKCLWRYIHDYIWHY